MIAASIIGDVLNDLYSEASSTDRVTCRKALQDRLFNWKANLGEDLSYDIRESIPPPRLPLITMNMTYWSAISLINRDLYVFFFTMPSSFVSPTFLLCSFFNSEKRCAYKKL